MKTFICPKNCSKINHKVFNTKNIYWYNSSVCQAAIHGGVMSDEGGEARLVYEPSMKVYDGTDSAGIKGRAEINAELLGFSFKVVGDPVSNINFFKETYVKEDFNLGWETIEA